MQRKLKRVYGNFFKIPNGALEFPSHSLEMVWIRNHFLLLFQSEIKRVRVRERLFCNGASGVRFERFSLFFYWVSVFEFKPAKNFTVSVLAGFIGYFFWLNFPASRARIHDANVARALLRATN